MPEDLKAWKGNWKRELEGVFLYSHLAELVKEPELKNSMEQMAEQEQKHSLVWAERVRSVLPEAQDPEIDLRIHLTLLLARITSVETVFPLLMNDEISDIASYTEQAQSLGDLPTYQAVVKDETGHARALARLNRPEKSSHTEPWHRGANASGLVRDMVYGFNDGLTANFGLVMGVVGAAVSSQFILLAGFAGLIADALSMAASGFLASRSEQEVRQYQLALERAELQLMPDEEREELTRIFKSKGLTQQEAQTVANRLMQNPSVTLTSLAREELGIDPEAPSNPLREGIITGVATAIGAIIPILPFLFLSGQAAIWTGILLSMAAHFLVGTSRAIFTGRPAIRSGFEMFAVGMGVALITYLIGLLLRIKV
jgi:vacuolar iron transporter family protein